MSDKVKTRWGKRKDGTDVMYAGKFRLLEIFKRPHGGYACFVFKNGIIQAMNGYHGKALPKRDNAVRWGINKAIDLKLIKNHNWRSLLKQE